MIRAHVEFISFCEIYQIFSSSIHLSLERPLRELLVHNTVVNNYAVPVHVVNDMTVRSVEVETSDADCNFLTTGRSYESRLDVIVDLEDIFFTESIKADPFDHPYFHVKGATRENLISLHLRLHIHTEIG